MRVEFGQYGPLPYAAVGTGSPVALLAGLSPLTGVSSPRLVRTMLSGLRGLAASRRVVLFNRRPGLPADLTMADLAAEHADALRAGFGEPVDVVGVSTGGSIAQQLAADHPDSVRRLVLVSTACRLGGSGKAIQAEVARHIRAGEPRRAIASGMSNSAPPWLPRPLLRAVGSAVAPTVLPTDSAASDLAVTIEAEDDFDLARCPSIAAATLIVAGARDRYYPQDLFRETAELIPGSLLDIRPRRGHTTVLTGRRGPAMIAGFLDPG